MIKKLFAKLKTLIDTYKIWVFVVAIFGTNGAQMYASYEPEPVETVKIAEPAKPSVKTTVIHKTDNRYCEDLINKHERGSQH